MAIPQAIVFGIISGCMGVLGDLAESRIKRNSGFKDSGTITAFPTARWRTSNSRAWASSASRELFTARLMPLAAAVDADRRASGVAPATGPAGALMPIDSEHGAIYQCLLGEDPREVSKLWVTASGGPFRGKTIADLEAVTPAQALAHPTWNMGAKISIDSSTLMNKGLEVIEAHHLFAMPYDQIEVVVQPQSAIHSMVEFTDGSVLAHLGTTDMRIPIQFALSYPERWEAPVTLLHDDIEVALHADIEDEGQTVSYAYPDLPLPPTGSKRPWTPTKGQAPKSWRASSS